MIYISFLANDADYQGVLLNRYSLKKHGSTIPYVCICLEEVSKQVVSALEADGIQVVAINFSNYLDQSAIGNEMKEYLLGSFWFGKFTIFMLTGSDKCIYLDADLLIEENLDHLFNNEVTDDTLYMVPDAVFGDKQIGWIDNAFNSGLIVYKPNIKLMSSMLGLAKEFESRDRIYKILRGDQEFFNYMRHIGEISIEPLPFKYNVYPSMVASMVNSGLMNKAAVVHFIGRPKPWHLLAANLDVSPFPNSTSADFYQKWLAAYFEYLSEKYTDYEKNNSVVSDAIPENLKVHWVGRVESMINLTVPTDDVQLGREIKRVDVYDG